MPNNDGVQKQGLMSKISDAFTRGSPVPASMVAKAFDAGVTTFNPFNDRSYYKVPVENAADKMNLNPAQRQLLLDIVQPLDPASGVRSSVVLDGKMPAIKLQLSLFVEELNKTPGIDKDSQEQNLQAAARLVAELHQVNQLQAEFRKAQAEQFMLAHLKDAAIIKSEVAADLLNTTGQNQATAADMTKRILDKAERFQSSQEGVIITREPSKNGEHTYSHELAERPETDAYGRPVGYTRQINGRLVVQDITRLAEAHGDDLLNIKTDNPGVRHEAFIEMYLNEHFSANPESAKTLKPYIFTEINVTTKLDKQEATYSKIADLPADIRARVVQDGKIRILQMEQENAKQLASAQKTAASELKTQPKLMKAEDYTKVKQEFSQRYNDVVNPTPAPGPAPMPPAPR